MFNVRTALTSAVCLVFQTYVSDYNVFNVRVSLISAVCLVFKTYVSDFHVFNVRAVLGCPSCCVSQLVFAINEYRCKQEKAFKPKELTSVL